MREYTAIRYNRITTNAPPPAVLDFVATASNVTGDGKDDITARAWPN